MPDTEKFACLIAVGDDRVGLVRDITAVLLDHGLTIPAIRSVSLGAEFAIFAYFGGTKEHIQAAENALAKLQQETGLSFLFHESKPIPEPAQTQEPTHDLFVTAYDAVGIVSELTAALAKHNINIDGLAGDRYPAPNQGVPLFTISASVHIPNDVEVDAVRTELEDLRDRRGWADADLLPHAQFDSPSLKNAPSFPPKNAWTKHDSNS